MNAASEQLTLLEAEEDALLLSREEAAKLYPATTVEKLAWKRDCILALLGDGHDVRYVATQAHASERIVKTLGAKYFQTVIANSQQMVKVLRGLAMKAAFLAGQKMEGARLGELSVFLGIAMQRAQEQELAGAALGDLADVIDVEAEESPALKSAREFVAALDQKKAGQASSPANGDGKL